jgi:copper chaperone
MMNTIFNVSEMSCDHCKRAIEGELMKLSGVEGSNADFEKGIVEVRYDEDLMTVEELRDAIEEAGYSVTA